MCYSGRPLLMLKLLMRDAVSTFPPSSEGHHDRETMPIGRAPTASLVGSCTVKITPEVGYYETCHGRVPWSNWKDRDTSTGRELVFEVLEKEDAQPGKKEVVNCTTCLAFYKKLH